MAEMLAHGVVNVARQRERKIVQRKNAADRRDHIDLVARPAGDAQHFVDGEPGHIVAPAFLPPQPLLLNGGDKPVILKCGGRRIVKTRLKR